MKIKLLNDCLHRIYEEHSPSQQELDHRESALKNLENILKTNFDENIQLVLFGSSRNGFGFKGSDLDLCLSFKDHPTSPPEEHSDPVKGNKIMITKLVKSN